ncbi:MAG: radical SAM protein [Planctomycetes bacterium]|nr:radical SAM protein [Planctomycetota bacterium]
MILCITNQCNRDCDYCFEGGFKQGPRRMMSVEDVRRICEFAHFARIPMAPVNIMGGEPTRHPQVIDILRLLRQLNPTADICLLTNLLCDPPLLQPLAGLHLRCLANVGGYPGYSAEERERLHRNLILLRNDRVFRSVSLAVTITRPDEDFEFLYEILRQDKPPSTIGGIRIGISCPGLDFANQFPEDFSPDLGEKYLEIVVECHRIRPLLAFRNECPVNLCMMSEATVARLTPAVEHLTGPCQGNPDILPGFSTHWCFAFEGVPEMRIESLFAYRNMAEVHAALRAKRRELESGLDPQCDAGQCKIVRCPGPCPAIRYYRQYVRPKR